VEKVKKSIEQYGYNQLIAVDLDHVIVAGHTRFHALKELGYGKLKVMVVDLDPEKAKAYRIIDNKSAEFSEWNFEDLSLEMRELADTAIMQEFFSESELKKMLESAAGVDYSDVTDENVAATESRLGSAELFHSKEKEVICPHCQQSFFIT
jgi:ParB-like chromosome segregation protein Spo0J